MSVDPGRPRGSNLERAGTTSASSLLRRYLSLALERWLLVLAIVAVTVGAGVGFWQLAPKSYTAESLLLVSSVPNGNPAYQEFPGLIGGGGGLTRDVETVSRIVATPEVAAEARRTLATTTSVPGLLKVVAAAPQGQSYLVTIDATDPSAERAAQIADAFAHATTTVMSARFQVQVTAVVAEITKERNALAPTATADIQAAQARLAQASALLGAPDPTIHLQAAAAVPQKPTTPGIAIIAPVALLIGLALAFVIVALTDLSDQRVRNEGQLTESFNLPLLARIPLGRRGTQGLIVDRENELAAAEAFRTLRQNVVVLRRDLDEPRSLLFTSASPAEGKTTCALNTAVALVESGQRVLLVDADFRHPNIGEALGAASTTGVVEVLRGEATLERSIVTPSEFGGRLEVLVFTPHGAREGEDAFSVGPIRALIEAASDRDVDFVIFDAPPLGLIADALPIATVVDDVFITVMRGRSSLPALRTLTAVLGRYGVRPRGIVYIGATRRDVAPVEEAMRSASAPSARDRAS